MFFPMNIKHSLITALLLAALTGLGFAAAGPRPKDADISKLDPAMAANKAAAVELAWHDVAEWGVEGRGWGDQERKRWYDRLPGKAEGRVTAAVWNLSRDSAGMAVRFRTDATEIHARYKLLKDRLAMPHMPATGVSGVDLYARGADGRWKWVQVVKPDKQSVNASIVTGLAPGEREYIAYLPLYNGIEKLEIGVPPKAKFERLAPRTQAPILFYGTSITHGASASRPGMVHTAILGRRFDLPVINLGFSGNGRMDTAVVELLCEQPASVYVIDCLPNMNAEQVSERTIPLVRRLREARPDTPIVLVEDRVNANAWLLPARAEHHRRNHAALREAFAKLQADGVKRIYYVEGDHLIGDDTDGTTDASHPNDLGFMRQADVFEPVLRAALAAR